LTIPGFVNAHCHAFQRGLRGLAFAYNPRPPRALPESRTLTYFQINLESSLDEWENVQKSLTVAIRLNENLIAGNIQGQSVLTIKTGGQTATLQFTLYVVANEWGGVDNTGNGRVYAVPAPAPRAGHP